MANRSSLLFPLFVLVAGSLAAVSNSDEVKCVYSMYVRTGSIFRGGTDSNIGVTLYDKKGNSVEIGNLVTWGGAMGRGHDYFESGNPDIFTGTAPCLETPPCAMNLTSDGSGEDHGWYCNYVEVTVTGVHAGCSQRNLEVWQWLARDAPPFRLFAYRNLCNVTGTAEDTFAPRKGLSSIMC